MRHIIEKKQGIYHLENKITVLPDLLCVSPHPDQLGGGLSVSSVLLTSPISCLYFVSGSDLLRSKIKTPNELFYLVYGIVMAVTETCRYLCDPGFERSGYCKNASHRVRVIAQVGGIASLVQ